MLSANEEKFLNDVFMTLTEYIKQSESPQKVAEFNSIENLKKLMPELQDQPLSHDEVLNELKVILNHSVKTIHPLFLNQLQGGFDIMAWIGEVASSLMNPTMATFEIAPVFTLIEKRLVAELLDLLGFKRGEGIMVTGGSNANLLSMLCARTDFNPSIRQTGFVHNRFRVYVSEEAHYSFDKAANITGIGTQNLILIPANERGEMVPEELERIIATDIKEGFIPLMVGATFGTTVLGAFDSLPKIAKICKKFKIWLHVDAAWGGGALFSRSAHHLLTGIEQADSVTFDAHKTLGTSLVTSFFLTKRIGILRNTNRGGGAEYLFHEYENSDWDTGTYSLQCGRRADSLKLWLLWRFYGTQGLIDRTEGLLALAQESQKVVESDPRFKLIHAHYLNICFQVLPRNKQINVDDFTAKVRKALILDGRSMVNYAQRADGTTFFRLVFPNHRTQLTHIPELFKIISEVADQVELSEEG